MGAWDYTNIHLFYKELGFLSPLWYVTHMYLCFFIYITIALQTNLTIINLEGLHLLFCRTLKSLHIKPLQISCQHNIFWGSDTSFCSKL